MAVTPASAHADPRLLRGAGTGTREVDELDRELRELVRREGVDPQRDADVVRRLAEGVVRRHDERSLTGAVAPLADADATVGELLARVSGFGPLQPLLDDPTVEEIWINDPALVRKGFLSLSCARPQARSAVGAISSPRRLRRRSSDLPHRLGSRFGG